MKHYILLLIGIFWFKNTVAEQPKPGINCKITHQYTGNVLLKVPLTIPPDNKSLLPRFKTNPVVSKIETKGLSLIFYIARNNYETPFTNITIFQKKNKLHVFEKKQHISSFNCGDKEPYLLGLKTSFENNTFILTIPLYEKPNHQK